MKRLGKDLGHEHKKGDLKKRFIFSSINLGQLKKKVKKHTDKSFY